MAISLVKGQKVDLTKGNPNLNKLRIGLGWDANTGIFGLGGGSFDLDAGAILLQEDKFSSKGDLVYFGNLSHKSGSILHSGDNLTGSGDGDDEVITVHLDKVPSNINRIVFFVNIYDAHTKNQNFSKVKNSYINVYNDNTNEKLIEYKLKEDFGKSTAVIAGEIYRKDNEWKFNAKGEGYNVGSISELTNKYK